MNRLLDYSDLECEVYDADDMAHLVMHLVMSLFETAPKDNIYRLTAREGGTLLFAARMMSEKAKAMRVKWEEIDQQQELVEEVRT